MRGAARLPDAWLIVFGSTGLAAWSALALAANDATWPIFCSSAAGRVPLSVSLDLALVLNSPARLAVDWTLMVAAMMLPLLISPLWHVHERSFARRRLRSMALLVAGYMAVWMIAGIGLQAVAVAGRWAMPSPLFYLSATAAAATLWQVSPAKQWFLNRCHSRPHLSAFGAAADRDAFVFGLKNGASCAGACWALMLLALFGGCEHIFGMIAVSLFVFAERLEKAAPLQWRWRGAGKGLRIMAAQIHMPMAARSL